MQISNFPEGGPAAPKHIGAFVIYFNVLIHVCAFVGTNNKQ
jgi:hypothetical protein